MGDKKRRPVSLGRASATHKRKRYALIRSAMRRRQYWRRAQLKKTPWCHYCRAPLTHKNATTDHYTPLARGGVDDVSNFRLSCYPCNQRKGDMHPDDYMKDLKEGGAIQA